MFLDGLHNTFWDVWNIFLFFSSLLRRNIVTQFLYISLKENT